MCGMASCTHLMSGMVSHMLKTTMVRGRHFAVVCGLILQGFTINPDAVCWCSILCSYIFVGHVIVGSCSSAMDHGAVALCIHY